MTPVPLVDLVRQWAASVRAERRARVEYERIATQIGERLNQLDDKAGYRGDWQRTEDELAQDRALMDELTKAGGVVMEAEATTSRLQAQMRIAADHEADPEVQR